MQRGSLSFALQPISDAPTTVFVFPPGHPRNIFAQISTLTFNGGPYKCYCCLKMYFYHINNNATRESFAERLRIIARPS